MLFSWEDAVVHEYALKLEDRSSLVPCDGNAVDKLKEMPANWTLDHDEDLAMFLSGHVEVDNENLGSIKNYVESIDVSSFCVSKNKMTFSSSWNVIDQICVSNVIQAMRLTATLCCSIVDHCLKGTN